MGGNKCSIGHAIVGGCGHLGSRIALGLMERGCSVTIIDQSPDDSVVARLRDAGCTIIQGDIVDDDTLARARITEASCYIAATGNDGANLESAIAAREANEHCPVIVRLYDQILGERVEKVFRIRALSASSLASPAFVSAATDDSIISALTVDGCCLSIHSAPSQPSHARGHFIGRTASGLRICTGTDPHADCLFAAVHTSSRQLYSRRPRANRKKRPSVLGVLSKLSPAPLIDELCGIWKHATSVTKRLTVTLLAVSVASVVVFWQVGGMSPLDALYFVVTTLTTVGYGDFNLQHAPAGLKAFGVIMMLSGAALLATIYAIIADRVLAARVEHLLGRKRVNLRGHTVVVGLGKVGYRVAANLKSLGVDLVGIEAVDDSDNVYSARSMFPVIIGDASRTSILSKAAVDTADTIIALTDNPLLNLSVALNAREYNPAIHTVVRTYDTDLAGKFRSFGLDIALSTSAIAAPVFVDAAIYPHVQGSFHFNDQDILVARYVIGSGSALLGKSPEQICVELGIAIVAVADGAQSNYQAADPQQPLTQGSRALALVTRSTVDALPNAQPA